MSRIDPVPLVTNNRDDHRYEVKMNKQLAVLTDKQQAGYGVFLHTDVPFALERRGIASQLASFALEDALAASHGCPFMPFVASSIRRHQEYLPLLIEAEQTRLLEGRESMGGGRASDLPGLRQVKQNSDLRGV